MRLHLRSLIACALLLACGPGEVIDTDTDGGTSSAATAGSDTGVDTDDAALSCAGARWVAIHDLGEYDRLSIDSLGRVYAFGAYYSADRAGVGMVTRFDVDGQVTDIIKAAVEERGDTRRGGVDGQDYVHALLRADNQPAGYQWWIVRHDPSGARSSETYLNGQAETPFEPEGLAIAPDGAAVIGGWSLDDESWVLQRRDPTGVILWEQSMVEKTDVVAINGDGLMAGARYSGVSVLEADGSLRWAYDLETTYPTKVDLAQDGGVVLAHERGLGSIELVRLSGDGDPLWTSAFMVASEHDKLADVAINASGAIAVGGYIQTTNPLTAWVARFSGDGEQLATYTCLDEADSRGHTVAIDRDGAVFVAGSVGVDGGYHGFVARFDPS